MGIIQTLATRFTAIDKLTAPVRKMSGAVQGFAKKAEAGVARLDRRLNKLGPSFGQLGKQMIAFAGTALLVSGLSSAVNTVKDYEQANANLASVMGTTVAANILLAKDAERLGEITAKSATEVVGLQESYARLGFAQQEIVNVTEATINGSIAMNAELDRTATLTGAMVRTFDSFSSIDAPEILDQMTLATQKSALNFEKLETALPIVSGAANAAGIPFDNLLALLGKLSDAGIDASSSSTALRNIFLDSAKKGHTYSQVLENIKGSQDQLTAANDEFGKRGAVSASILARNIDETAKLTKILASAAKGQEMSGVAADTAGKQMDTTTGALTLLSSKYEGLLLSINKGTGAMSGFRTVIEFVANNLTTIAVVIGVLVGGFLALKLAVLASQLALFGYNVVLGVTGALSGTASIAIGANTIALNAYKFATIAATAMNHLFNASNPIGWIILAVSVIALIVTKFDSWGAAISMLLGPIGFLIGFIVSLHKNWQMVTDAFTNGGILGGIKAIGKVMLDALLYPVQQLLEMVDKIPGIDIAGDFAKDIQKFRMSLGVETAGSIGNEPQEEYKPAPLINNEANKQNQFREIFEKTLNSTVDLNINDPNNRTSIETRGAAPGVNLSRT